MSGKSYYKQRYDTRRENHKCTACGAALDENYFYVQCPKCRRYYSEYNKKKKTAGAAPNGQKKIS